MITQQIHITLFRHVFQMYFIPGKIYRASKFKYHIFHTVDTKSA